MDKRTFVEGIASGAVADTIAGLMRAPKSGKPTRDKIAVDLVEIKDKIIARLEALEDCTQEKYAEIVKVVLAESWAAKKIMANEAKEIEARLQDGYEAIRKTIHEYTTAPAVLKTA